MQITNERTGVYLHPILPLARGKKLLTLEHGGK
jgi:hypothetical protein